MKTRLNIACVLNVILPGAGLIIARREWLGVAFVGVFSTAANVAVIGRWIEPERVPRQAWATALAVAAGAWLAAQWALVVQRRRLMDPSIRDQILTCYDVAERAIGDGSASTAVDALRVAVVVDDENIESYARLARASASAGEIDAALHAWRRVRQLDRAGRYASEARSEMSRLKSAAADPVRP